MHRTFVDSMLGQLAPMNTMNSSSRHDADAVMASAATSSSVEESSRKLSKYYYWEFGQTIGSLMIFCIVVIGNLSILHRLKFDLLRRHDFSRRRRSNVNYFIIQLAIADLFVGFFSITLDSVWRLQKSFPYGTIACQASKYVSVSRWIAGRLFR